LHDCGYTGHRAQNHSGYKYRLRLLDSSSNNSALWKPRVFRPGEETKPFLPLDFSQHLCYKVLMNEALIRTISIKLDVDGHEDTLQETQKHFNAAASWIAAICWNEHIRNTNTAHQIGRASCREQVYT